jgi:glutamine---fructose-6-phosphate transaminase (isomerizing)
MSTMLEETREQPRVLARTLEEGLGTARDLRVQFDRRHPRLVVLVARGAAGNAAQFGRYLIEIATGIPVSLAAPSTLTLYGSALDLAEVLVVGISPSGESGDTNAVLEYAGAHGAVTVGITNERGSAMARIAAHTLRASAGEAAGGAETKTYPCQLLTFYLLAYALGGAVGLEAVRHIPDWVEAVLDLDERVGEVAERYTFMSRAVTVGRGLNYSNALELGMKLMETCAVEAEGFSSAELTDGWMEVVERSLPVFVFAPSGVTWPSIAGTLDLLEDRHAETLVFTDESNTAACAKPARLIQLPLQPGCKDGCAESHPDLYTPIPYIVPAQLFAAHLAAIKGLHRDRPRSLGDSCSA